MKGAKISFINQNVFLGRPRWRGETPEDFPLPVLLRSGSAPDKRSHSITLFDTCFDFPRTDHLKLKCLCEPTTRSKCRFWWENSASKMGRGPEAVVAVAAVGLVSAVLAAGISKRSRKCRRQSKQKGSGDEPKTEWEAPFNELFGEEKRMTVVVEAIGESHAAERAAAADRETVEALLSLLGLVLSVWATTCFLAVALATGSFLLLAGSVGVGYFLAAPAAVGVRDHWGRALDEALDDSIRTTGAPWDLAVI